MKKLTRKITLSLVAILFAVIALGTTTYAWFTLGTSATVSSIDGTVKAAEGIEVSLDYNTDNSQKNWSNSLKFSKEKAYLGSQKIGTATTLTNLALVAEENKTLSFYDTEAKFSTVDPKEVTGTAIEPNKSGSYLAFDLYVKVSGQNLSKNLVVNGVEITSNVKNWVSDVTTDGNELETGKTYDVYASNAARVSFAKVDNDAVRYKGTFELNKAQSGETNNAFPGDTASQNGLAKKYADAKGYTGAKDMFDNFTLFNNGTTKTGNDLLIDTITTGVDKETYLQYRVYIWLNGFDGDCINAILGESLTVNFKLELK